jgi:hypothetical protein
LRPVFVVPPPPGGLRLEKRIRALAEGRLTRRDPPGSRRASIGLRPATTSRHAWRHAQIKEFILIFASEKTPGARSIRCSARRDHRPLADATEHPAFRWNHLKAGCSRFIDAS